ERPEDGVGVPAVARLAGPLLRRDRDPDRSPPALEHALVVLRELIPSLVQDREAHHVPLGAHRPYLLHLEHPARGDPRPRALRIEPEVGGLLGLRGLVSHLCTFTSVRPVLERRASRR